MDRIIVSRHPAAIEFIRRAANLDMDVIVIASATVDDVRGKDVYGNIPMNLATHAAGVWAVEFDGAPPRGAEYDMAAMVAAGAKLVHYGVLRIPDDLSRDRYLQSGGFCV